MLPAVLHTAEQRKTAEEHVEKLQKKGENAVAIVCSDISRLASLDMNELSSLHLIVDTRLYGILMIGGFLCDIAKQKFKELEKSGKNVYVLNTFQAELNDLYHQIPRNVRNPVRLDDGNVVNVYSGNYIEMNLISIGKKYSSSLKFEQDFSYPSPDEFLATVEVSNAKTSDMACRKPTQGNMTRTRAGAQLGPAGAPVGAANIAEIAKAVSELQIFFKTKYEWLWSGNQDLGKVKQEIQY